MDYNICTGGVEGTWHTISGNSIGSRSREKELLMYLRIKGIIILDGVIHDNKLEWRATADPGVYDTSEGLTESITANAVKKLPSWVRVEILHVPADVFFFMDNKEVPGSEEYNRVLCIYMEDEYRVPIIRKIRNQGPRYGDYSIIPPAAPGVLDASGITGRNYYYDSDYRTIWYSRISVSTEEVLREVKKIIGNMAPRDQGAEAGAGPEGVRGSGTLPEAGSVGTAGTADVTSADENVLADVAGVASFFLEDNNMAERLQVGKELLSYYIEYSKRILSKVRITEDTIMGAGGGGSG